MLKVRERLSLGDVHEQMSSELKMIPKEEREKLMKDADFTYYYTTWGRSGNEGKLVLTLEKTQNHEKVCIVYT